MTGQQLAGFTFSLPSGLSSSGSVPKSRVRFIVLPGGLRRDLGWVKQMEELKMTVDLEESRREDDFDLLPEPEAAKAIFLEPHTLTVWRCKTPHKAPPYLRLGRKVFYRKSDLRTWIAAQVVRTGEGA
jgi:hypothetical protein